jgi:DNA-binding MarR family transcriptional regulator
MTENVSLAEEEFRGCLAGNLRAASRLVSRTYNEHLRSEDLRITQLALLAGVRRSDGATISELGSELYLERSALARDLKLLERAGLVAVGLSSTDGRAREVHITKQGEAKLRAVAPLWRKAQEATHKRLGEANVAGLLDALTTVMERVE